MRNYEISVEVPLQRLRALGLTLTDIANTIRRGSLDLSAGSIDTEQSQVRIRTLGQSYDQQDFEDIVILGRDDGTVLRLGDIAEVRDGFEESGLTRPSPGQACRVRRGHASRRRAGDGRGERCSGPTWRNEAITLASRRRGHQHLERRLFGHSVERAVLLLKNGALGLLLVLDRAGPFSRSSGSRSG